MRFFAITVWGVLLIFTTPILVVSDSFCSKAATIRPVSPGIVTGTVNNEFDVSVEVADVANLFGISFELNYNSTYLNAVSEIQGAFLGNDILFFPQEGLGKVSFGITKKAGQSGSTGTGYVVNIRFKVIQSVAQNAAVIFSISAVTANDPSGNPISLTPGSTTKGIITKVENCSSSLSEYALYQNHPNPFNPITTIHYSLSKPGIMTLTLYDGLGRQVAVLAEGYQQVGDHEVTFNANGLSSGFYYYRLQTDNKILSRMLMLIK